jgi:hypothetical protein
MANAMNRRLPITIQGRASVFFVGSDMFNRLV